MPILRRIAQLGQPVLRQPGRPIASPAPSPPPPPRDPEIQVVIDDMLATIMKYIYLLQSIPQRKSITSA